MTTIEIVTTTEQIFEQGNKHMQEKLRAFGDQGQAVIKYIVSKLRKYNGSFFESNKTISENVGCSVRTVQNTIKKAEQLNIFAVSPRKELEELTGKARQTTNLIQLLAYTPLKKAKKIIVETVRKVVERAEVVVQEVKNVVKAKVFKGSKNQYGQKQYGQKSVRKEIVPDWLANRDQEQVSKPATEDEIARMQAILDKYKR
ncbi:hypothetical protein COE51_17135 [Bacillus pseudomycoides]|nr:hypothetical protein COE51_17135 [Bacillus pseudomycoides]